MNRKLFLSSILPSSLLLSGFTSSFEFLENSSDKKHKTPPYLKSGDTIGITCPAGFITLLEIMPAIQQMENWGFKVMIGKTVGQRDFTFGGTDEERLMDMQQMLDDSSIKAIMCARGGYGVIRILDRLDFSQCCKNPKWIIGFSDITVLHCHLNSNYQFASIHSKMCNSFPADWLKADELQQATIKSIEQALKGEELMKYSCAYHSQNRLGKARGELVGGNLRCIENLAGSKSEIQTDGKILFLEDVGEYLYSIDRMFYNLLRSGKLNKLKGLIIGGFRIRKDEENDDFGKSLEQIVLEKVATFNYPVCFNFPIGHQKANYALKCGVKHHLIVDESGTTLEEIV